MPNKQKQYKAIHNNTKLIKIKSDAKFVKPSLILFFTFLFSLHGHANTQHKQAIHHYQDGNYQAFVELASGKLESNDLSSTQQFRLKLYQADARQKLGQPVEALTQLLLAEEILNDYRSLNKAKNQLLLNAQFGSLYTQLNSLDKATSYLDKALAYLPKVREPSIKAKAMNDIALLMIKQGKTEKARQLLNQAQSLMAKSSSVLTASINTNLARLAVEEALFDELDDTLKRAVNSIDALIGANEKAFLYVAVGSLYSEALNRYEGVVPQHYRGDAYQQYQQAIATAKQSKDNNLQAYAYGEMATLYEDVARNEEAAHYGRQALFYAQQSGNKNSLYQWQWLVARTTAMQGKLIESALIFEQALETVESIRYTLAEGAQGSYRSIVGPLYYQYADLQLHRTAAMAEGKQKQQILFDVRDALEDVKRAEIEDYFNNQCLKDEGDDLNLDTVLLETVVLYPVLLEDRIELLISNGKKIQQFKAPVRLNKLTQTVRDFRLQIERETGTSQYKKYSQQLYTWLIQPIQNYLDEHQIHTMVIIPDGPLRTIPFSALYDGNQYLIEKYAVATAPGLSMIDSKPLEKQNINVFAGGISESVQGFDALPNVGKELASLQQNIDASIYQDKKFTNALLESQLKAGQFNVAHLATHGEFLSDYKKSFLLTHDGRFTLSSLEETVGQRGITGKEPLELLVLSACQTAAGDDRAALGLAGVAIQAGARSALASLWSINDEATFELVNEFYVQLQKKSISKAESLRRAQLKLIANNRYEHPSNWSPFLLIGNWL